MIDQACCEADPVAVVRSKDDGKRGLVVKGGSIAQGAFLRISGLLRNGKGFSIVIPCGINSSGWANVCYILCRSFGFPISLAFCGYS